MWATADTVVWVSPSRLRMTWQSVTRTVRRLVTRQELWIGNREGWRDLLFWRREDSVHRVRTRREVDSFVARVTEHASAPE